MEELSKEELCRQLKITDASIPFLVLLLLSAVLALVGGIIRRTGLCDLLSGKTEKLPDVFQIYLVKNAILVGAFTFFLSGSLSNWENSKCRDEVVQSAARMDMWVSVLGLASALLQLINLIYVQTHQPGLEEEFFPE